MMKTESDRVIIDISVDQYHTLLLALGYAIGASENEEVQEASAWARKHNRRDIWLALANAINEGNPNWTPYQITEHAAKTTAEGTR